MSPPRFDVGELAELSGPPLWQSVHAAVVQEVTEGAIFVEVRPRGHEPLRAMIDPEELVAAPEAGTELSVRLLDPVLPGDEKIREEANLPPLPIASFRQAESLILLDRIIKAKEASEKLGGLIVAEIKGGYTVALGAAADDDTLSGPAVRAFLPKSHGEHPRLHEARSAVGEHDKFELTEVEPERANVVLSRRKALNQRYKEAVASLWDSITVGETVTGRVRALVPYGAFVDLGGMDALLHASDLSWDRQPRVSSVLHVGNEVTAQIISANKETGKVKIGLKQLIPNPWNEIKKEIRVGADIDGVVVSLTDYGVFVRLRDGVEGLIHLSEVSWDRVTHVSKRFTIGDAVTARVLDVDIAGQRISLSTKALEPNPFEKVAEAFPKGTVVRAAVKSLTDFGAFVSLNENVDGLIHIGEMSWTEHVTHPSQMLTLGEDVEIVVLDVDIKRQRVACSIKQLAENPWKAWESKFQRGKRITLKASRVSDRGVYFDIEEGLTGYCSGRDLSSDPGLRPADIVKPGEEIELEVKGLDRRRRQVQLSARAVVEGDTRAAYDEYKKREAETGAARTTLGDAFKNQLGGGAKAEAAEVEAAEPEAAEPEAVEPEAAEPEGEVSDDAAAEAGETDAAEPTTES